MHSRGTQGQIGYNVTDKTGEVVGVIAAADSDEVMCITSQGKTLKLEASAISRQGRTSQGVCILKIDAPDFVIGADRVEKEE